MAYLTLPFSCVFCLAAELDNLCLPLRSFSGAMSDGCPLLPEAAKFKYQLYHASDVLRGSTCSQEMETTSRRSNMHKQMDAGPCLYLLLRFCCSKHCRIPKLPEMDYVRTHTLSGPSVSSKATSVTALPQHAADDQQWLII